MMDHLHLNGKFDWDPSNLNGKFDWDYIGTGMTFVVAIVACDNRGLSHVATRSLGCTPTCTCMYQSVVGDG